MNAGAIGGTAEALGGGKFANGAVTGAYVMMFNHVQSQQRERARQELQKKIKNVTIAERNRAIRNKALLELYKNTPSSSADGYLQYNINVDFDVDGLRYGRWEVFENVSLNIGDETIHMDVHYRRSRLSSVTDINWFKNQPASYVSPGGPRITGYLIEFRNQGNVTLSLIRFQNYQQFELFRNYLSGD
ncbi:MAG: hypothetical protein EA412_01075 [Chitinophagaceae bacterium]|nr:MAG: hypothetical protein EA412_01075 [Chitinophagaceae bacterium]